MIQLKDQIRVRSLESWATRTAHRPVLYRRGHKQLGSHCGCSLGQRKTGSGNDHRVALTHPIVNLLIDLVILIPSSHESEFQRPNWAALSHLIITHIFKSPMFSRHQTREHRCPQYREHQPQLLTLYLTRHECHSLRAVAGTGQLHLEWEMAFSLTLTLVTIWAPATWLQVKSVEEESCQKSNSLNWKASNSVHLRYFTTSRSLASRTSTLTATLKSQSIRNLTSTLMRTGILNIPRSLRYRLTSYGRQLTKAHKSSRIEMMLLEEWRLASSWKDRKGMICIRISQRHKQMNHSLST